MQNLDHEHTGAFRPRRIGLLGAAVAALTFFVPAMTATASLRGDSAAIAQISTDAKLASTAGAKAEAAADARIELAGNEHRDTNFTKPPARGSSAELYGGSSADRYGGSSADRRGVAGRYDPRNRGVRQYQASNNRKRGENRPKQNDEMDDQDQDPPQDRFSFTPPDPSAAMNRSRD
jgi:hypothetical protein